jgi:hypothetical protein
MPVSAAREPDAMALEAEQAEPTVPEDRASDRQHAQIQWLLATLGKGLGLDVHVARNDRSLKHEGRSLGDLSIATLPAQFDPVARKILELIDVLWLDRNQIVCAFEVEHSTDVHSGLLRMSDLLAVQPHTSIALYIVAPDDRRAKVIREVNRPTFFYANRPLYTLCKYISYSRLQKEASETKRLWPYMKYDFMDQIAEACITGKAEASE